MTGDRGLRWITIALTLAMVPYAALIAFAHPVADDLAFAAAANVEGFWPALRIQYFSWNGRFASDVLALLNPIQTGSVLAYRLTLLALFLLTFAALYALVRVATRPALTRRESLACALALGGVYISQTPALGETFYWFTGAVVYQVACIAGALQIASFLEATDGEVSVTRRRLYAVLAAVLIVFVVGLNEVAMLMMVIFYAVAAAWSWRDGRAAVTRIAFLMLAVGLGASMLVIGSPGNAMRQAMYPAHLSVVRSVGGTVLQTVRFGVWWAASGTLVLATILYLPFAERVAAARVGLSRLGDRYGVALIALPLAAIPLSVFPAYWATGILGQHRTVSVGFFAFLMLWFACVTAMVGSSAGGSSILRRRGLKPAIAVVFVAAIGLGGNGYTIAADFLYHRPQQFSAEMKARAATLDACRAAPDRACRVPPSVNAPESIFFLDVSPDSTYWINEAYARFYGLRQVQLALSDDHVRH